MYKCYNEFKLFLSTFSMKIEIPKSMILRLLNVDEENREKKSTRNQNILNFLILRTCISLLNFISLIPPGYVYRSTLSYLCQINVCVVSLTRDILVYMFIK